VLSLVSYPVACVSICYFFFIQLFLSASYQLHIKWNIFKRIGIVINLSFLTYYNLCYIMRTAYFLSRIGEPFRVNGYLLKLVSASC